MTSDNSKAPERINIVVYEGGEIYETTGAFPYGERFDQQYTLTSTIPQWNTDMDAAPNKEDVFLYQEGWAINPVIVGRRDGDFWLSDCFDINDPDQRPTHWMHITPPEDT